MTSYSVVHFFEDNSVEAVPSYWVKKNGTCAWPQNQLSAAKLIERKTIPNEIDFNYFKARILKNNIESLISAKAFADKATIISDLSGDDDKSKRKLLAKKKTQSYSDCPEYPESEDEAFNETLNLKRSAAAGWSPSPKKKDSEDEVYNKTGSLKRPAGWSPSQKKKAEKVQLNSSIAINSIKRPTTSIGASIHKSSIVKKLSYNESPIESYGKGIMSYKISDDDDNNNENNYTAGSNNNDNSNSLRLAEIKHANNKSPQLIIATPPASRSLVVTSEGLITPTELGKDFQKEVLHTLSFIKHELRRIVNNQRDLTQRFDVMESILEKMQSSSNLSDSMNKSSTPITDVTGSYSLPLDNLQDLKIFEERISEDGTFRINLVSQLSYLGGKHVKAVVKRLMGKLFKDELLKDFSYTGKKGKKKFSTLTTCSVIFDAVKTQAKFKQVSQSELEDIIKYILAQAPFNIKRQIEKENLH